jgi:hypothetical protein
MMVFQQITLLVSQHSIVHAPAPGSIFTAMDTPERADTRAVQQQRKTQDRKLHIKNSTRCNTERRESASSGRCKAAADPLTDDAGAIGLTHKKSEKVRERADA